MTRVASSKSLCCPDCFAFPWLKKYVSDHGLAGGECDYCNSIDVPVLEIGELEPYFQNFMGLYQRYTGEHFTHGESLIDKVQFGWGVFDEDEISEDDQRRLLEDILNCTWDDDDGEPPIDADEDFVSRGAPWHDAEHDRWSDFCSEVRNDPKKVLHFADYITEDLSAQAIVLNSGTELHRARLGCIRQEDGDVSPYVGGAIGAPPPDKAVAGRGNREGQVVLYCADDTATALAEVRPAQGMLVSICKVTLTKDARILDLTDDLEINPFTSENARYELEFSELVSGFAEEMSRPLERTDDHTHYVPCQKLCEYLAANGFDGVRYPSAMQENGTNVLFFEPSVGQIGDSQLARVTTVKIDFDEVVG